MKIWVEANVPVLSVENVAVKTSLVFRLGYTK